MPHRDELCDDKLRGRGTRCKDAKVIWPCNAIRKAHRITPYGTQIYGHERRERSTMVHALR